MDGVQAKIRNGASPTTSQKCYLSN